MGKLFGTDGIRGIANKELTAELAFKIAQAGALILKNKEGRKSRILIGKDTRISGDMLEAAIIAGVCSIGSEAITAGVIPTPGAAYLTRLYKADAAIVISASHNPVEYNGIKFFNSEGYKLSDKLEDKIENCYYNDLENINPPYGNKIGYKTELKNAREDYINFAISTIDTYLNGLKIAIDCANGAAYKVAREALSKLGAEVYSIHDKPDGKNINLNCGSTHIDNLASYVTKVGADVGLAFDGDADRVLAVDENGNIVDGDKIIAICSNHLRKLKKLKDNVAVVTVMSNIGLNMMAEENNIRLLKTKVGDRYVLEEMKKGNYSIGGEQSGHVIFLDHNTTGDGLITALQLLNVIKRENKMLSELASIMKQYPQVLVNAKVSNENKYNYMENNVIKDAVEKLEKVFNNKGRVLIRPSGTEPLVRVMIEGEDKNFIKQKAKELASLIEKNMN